MTGALRSDTLADAIHDAALRLFLPFARAIGEAVAMPGWSALSATERLVEIVELCAEQVEILAEKGHDR